MKTYAYQFNGVIGVVAINDASQVSLYRSIAKQPNDGAITDTAVIVQVIRRATPLKGNVSPDLVVALENAIQEMLKCTIEEKFEELKYLKAWAKDRIVPK
jgi:hypothetical protein